MTLYLSPDDLAPFADIEIAKASAMIDDALALAVAVAPCLGDDEVELTAAQGSAVRAVLRAAVLRWNDAGTGALQMETAGPFSVQYDNRQTRRSLFWPSEIEQLIAVCTAATGTGGNSGAFAVDTVGTSTVHADVCAVNLGANYCSCGAVLAGFPLWEVQP